MIIKKLFNLKIIILLAMVLRLSFLGTNPLSLNWDEVSMGYTAYSLAETGKDEWGETLPIFFRSYGEWKSAVYIYLLVPFVSVFGLEPWVVRLPSALAGILAVYLIYLLGKRLYSEKVGLWSAFLLSVTPWHLVLSRPAFEANVSLTLLLLGVYGLVRAAQTNWQWSGLILSIIGFGLAPHTYNSAKIIVPFVFFFLTVATGFYKKPKQLLITLFALGVFALPIILSIFSGVAQYRYTQVGITTDQTSITKFYESRATFPLGEFGNKLVFNKATFFVYQLTENWANYFNPRFLFIEGGEHKQHHMIYRGILYLIQGLFIIFGLKLSLKKSQPLSFLPLALIALGFIPAALTRDSEHVLRSILAIPGFILLAAVGADYLESSKTSRTFFKAISAILTIEILSFLFMYFAWYPKVTARDWQYGYAQAAEYTFEHEDGYDEIIVTKWHGEPHIFFAFYNRWDPVWYQQENKKLIGYEEEGYLWLDQIPEYHFGKYTFRYLDWGLETRKSNTLYVGKFDDFYEDSNYKQKILYPDGTVSLHIVEGERE
jgi:4-amino-4-deoxy-L-arabinose transferase-like glycosyltransferase